MWTLTAVVHSVSYNAVTQCIADVMCQKAELEFVPRASQARRRPRSCTLFVPKHCGKRAQDSAQDADQYIDVDRVIRFTISSGIVGGCLNYALFNGILPMLLPGNSLRTILAKVAFNNTIAKMMSAFAVISTSALLQGRCAPHHKCRKKCCYGPCPA